jgi:transposase-like protein
VPKRLRDIRVEQVRVQRIRCTACGETRRHYPTGVTVRKQSERLRGLSIILWLLGLSYRAVMDVLAALDCRLSYALVYHNVQQAGESVRQLQARRVPERQVRVLAADCTHVRVQGEDTILIHLADGEKGLCLAIDLVAGEDAESLQEALEEVAAAVGAEILLTDDADAFKDVGEKLGLAHALCHQHVVPNTLRKLAQIAQQLEQELKPGNPEPAEKERIAAALEDILELEQHILWGCPGSQPHLDRLARKYEQETLPSKGQRATPFARLKLLTLRLATNWPRLTLNESRRTAEGQKFIPRTNNVSEQGIGLNIKERYRTMRGYKSKVSLLRVTALTAHLRDEDDEALIRALSA